MANYQKEENQRIQRIFEDDKKKTLELETKIKTELSNSINVFNKNKTDSNKINVARHLHNTMQYIRNGALAIFVMVAFALTACNKSTIEPQPKTPDTREMVTQVFKMNNLYVEPMHSKGFDPLTWVYNWNATKYNLTFTCPLSPANNVTKSVSISELIAGTAVTLYPAVYDIAFNSSHSPSNLTKLDASISMTAVNFTGITPIPLLGNYEDALIVVNLQNITSITATPDVDGNTPEFTLLNGFYYAYMYKTGSTLMIYTVDGYKEIILPALAKGNVYWYVNPIAANTSITFPNWVINKITVN